MDEQYAGGSAYAITGVLDTMKAVKPDISTIALGQCISTSTLLLVGGAYPFFPPTKFPQSRCSSKARKRGGGEKDAPALRGF